MSLRRTHALAAIVSTILLAACGGYGDDGTAPPTPAFTLSATPTTLEVQAGGPASAVAAADLVNEAETATARASTVVGTGTINVSITRSGGFEGAVSVAVEGLPASVTATSLTIPAGSTNGSITVNAAASAVVGSASLTLRGTGTGVTAQTASVQLTITAAPAFGLTLTPVTLSIPQGQAGSSTANIARSGGFTGAVALSSAGAPAGITVAFTPASATDATSAIAVSVAGSVALGTYPITVQGSGTGVTNQSAVLTVTVTAPPGSIVLTTSPATLSVQQGASATTTLTIARTNFTGTVNLTSPGAPAGVSVTFNPSGTTATTSTVTVAVAASVTAGSYQLTLQGAGSGIANASLTVSLSVTTAGSGNTTWTFCAQSGLPLWFAYQDFGGAWTQVVAANHVYNFNINARGAVAWVMQQGAKTSLTIRYESQQDLATRGSLFCRGNGSIKTINVNALGVGANELAYVTMGSAGGYVQAGTPNPFQVTNVADGVLDLIGVKSAALTLNSIVIQRDRNDANGANLTVDFATGVAPVTRTATIANLGAEQVTFGCNFFSKNNGLGLLNTFPQASTSSTQTWKGFPDASVIDGDFHVCTAYATPAGSPFTGNPGRGINQWNKFAADRTYTLPDAITTPPTLTVLGTSPYVTLTTSWIIQSTQHNARWMAGFAPASGPVSSVSIVGTAGYFGSGPVQLAIPAFGAGFNPAHGLQPGIPVTWSFSALGGNVLGGVEGATNTFSNVAGAPFTP